MFGEVDSALSSLELTDNGDWSVTAYGRRGWWTGRQSNPGVWLGYPEDQATPSITVLSPSTHGVSVTYATQCLYH